MYILIEVCMEFGACVPQRQIYRVCMKRWKNYVLFGKKKFVKEVRMIYFAFVIRIPVPILRQ